MDELSLQISLVIYFLLSEVRLSWKSDLVAFLHLDDDEDRLCVIPADNFINLNVCLLRLWPSRVPSNDLLLAINLAHHIEHLFMVDVVNEPDIRFLEIFLEWHCVTICDIQHALICIFTKQDSNYTLFSSLSHSIVVVYD